MIGSDRNRRTSNARGVLGVVYGKCWGVNGITSCSRFGIVVVALMVCVKLLGPVMVMLGVVPAGLPVMAISSVPVVTAGGQAVRANARLTNADTRSVL